MKIRLFGQRNILGMGVHFSAFASGLKSMRAIGTIVEEFDILNPDAVQSARASSRKDDVNIWFFGHELMTSFSGRNVAWAIFETDVLPLNYVRSFAGADAVWVPSAWARDVLIGNGLPASMVDIVPEGVNGSDYHPFLRERRTNPTGVFNFLAVGKYEARKGYEALLEGFGKAFRGDPTVRLIIKGDYFLKHGQKKIALETLVNSSGLRNVLLVWGSWNSDMLFGLYNKADCFVFPSRAEGWGLPLIEAIACGLPIVATYYSGHTEYLSKIRGNFREIDYTLEAVRDQEFLGYWKNMPPGREPKWAEPSADSIAYQMQRVREGYQDEQQRALQNSARIRSEFDWQTMVDLAMDALSRRRLLELKMVFPGAPFNEL